MTESVKPKNEIAKLSDIAPKNTLSTVIQNKNDISHKFERYKRTIKRMKFSAYLDIEVGRKYFHQK